MSAKKDKKAGKPSEENKKRRKKPAKPLKMADGEKIPKGVDRTHISVDSQGEGHIIMTTSYDDLTKSSKPKKSAGIAKPAPAGKSKTPKKTPAAPKKPAAAKAPKLKPIKHSDEYENGTGGDKNHIIVVGKKQQKPRASRRELKRVRSGGYTVFDGKRAGKTFETAEEAANYAVDVLIRTGEAVPVERTDRQVTHTFKPEEQKKKK